MNLWVKEMCVVASGELYNLMRCFEGIDLYLQTTLTIKSGHSYSVRMCINVFASVWATLCFTVHIYEVIFEIPDQQSKLFLTVCILIVIIQGLEFTIVKR